MKVNTRSGEYAGKTNNCHLEASHTHTVTANIDWLKQWLEWVNHWRMALQMYWMGQDGDANKHAQASRRLPLTKRIQLIRLALCWNVRTDHCWKINVSGKKKLFPGHNIPWGSQISVSFVSPGREPWEIAKIRETHGKFVRVDGFGLRQQYCIIRNIHGPRSSIHRYLRNPWISAQSMDP